MKRKEQIQDAAVDHRDGVCCGFYDPVADARQDSFICGAEWADEHPKPEMINKQKFIDNARKWLSNNKDNYIIDIEGETLVDDQIITDFCKIIDD